MKKVFATSMYSFLTVMLLFSVIHIGCSSRRLDQNQQNILEQPQENAPEQRQKKVISAKPKETSIFSVIEIEDVEYPTLEASIRLPFSVNSDNTVVLVEKHAYLTTERHLHVIDISIPQRPVYLTSLAFADNLGKVLASGNHLVVATRKTFHLVDVSQPSSPVLQSTVHLPYRHAIKAIDVHDRHLYVIGENDSLYIFSVPRGQAQLIKAVKLEKRWWLLSPKVGGAEIEQIPLSTSNIFPRGLSIPLLSQRGFLQLRSSQDEKVRASSEFLGVERLKNPTTDIQIYDACRRDDHKMSTGVSYYNMDGECREHLATTGEKRLTRQKPTLAYRVGKLGDMQQIAQNLSSETIDINTKGFMGPLTDFQISDDLLCVVSEKGFLAIHRLVRLENSHHGETSQFLSLTPFQFLSLTPLQTSRPISIAIGQDYVCVLAVSRVSQR